MRPVREEYLPNRAGDQSYREALDAFLLTRYREALEKIADEAQSECGCESIGSHACDVRDVARKALEDR